MSRRVSLEPRRTLQERRDDVVPDTGIHILRNLWTQTRELGRYCELLEDRLDAAIESTRNVVPRRALRGFRIASVPTGSRAELAEYKARSIERAIEQELYAACGPEGSFAHNDVWGRLVAYQVPLFDHAGRDKWGHVDLLGIDDLGQPVVVELKRGESRETPLRCLMEGVANAIVVQANWEQIRSEIDAIPQMKSIGLKAAIRIGCVKTVVLAPANYWSAWEPRGTPGYAVSANSRLAFHRLTARCAIAGFPVQVAEFTWPLSGHPDPRDCRKRF